MKTAGISAATATSQAEYESSLPGQLHRLDSILKQLQGTTIMLRQKNNQLIYAIAYETPEPACTIEEGLPLIPELINQITRINDAVSELSQVVNHTLTI